MFSIFKIERESGLTIILARNQMIEKDIKKSNPKDPSLKSPLKEIGKTHLIKTAAITKKEKKENKNVGSSLRSKINPPKKPIGKELTRATAKKSKNLATGNFL